jgi:hypothetical protein
MERDPLIQLLQRADCEAGGPPLFSDDLPDRVRCLARRRRRVLVGHSVLAASLAILVCVLAGRHVLHRRDVAPGPSMAKHDPAVHQAPSSAEELLAIRAEVERLRAELIATREEANSVAQPDTIANSRSIDDELERAAYLVVYQANRYDREMSMPEQAIASYRQTVSLFPRTRAAQMARDRLSQLEKPKGTQL